LVAINVMASPTHEIPKRSLLESVWLSLDHTIPILPITIFPEASINRLQLEAGLT